MTQTSPAMIVVPVGPALMMTAPLAPSAGFLGTPRFTPSMLSSWLPLRVARVAAFAMMTAL